MLTIEEAGVSLPNRPKAVDRQADGAYAPARERVMTMIKPAGKDLEISDKKRHTQGGIIGAFLMLVDYKEGLPAILEPFADCSGVWDLVLRLHDMNLLTLGGIFIWLAVLVTSSYYVCVAAKLWLEMLIPFGIGTGAALRRVILSAISRKELESGASEVVAPENLATRVVGSAVHQERTPDLSEI
jgi:hypothetical protein